MQSTAVFVFCLVVRFLWIRKVSAGSIELTPSSVTICPRASVTIKCTIQEADSNYTRWTIFPIDAMHEIVELTLNDITPVNMRFSGFGINFLAKWISFSPLCSTLMTTATRALDGAVVKCSHDTLPIMESLTITVRDGHVPTLCWLNVTSEILHIDNVTVFVEWESNEVSEIDYIVTITPSFENGSIINITTRQESYRFTLPYNDTFTLAVVGINCAGRSNQLNKTFSYTQSTTCEQPRLTENFIQKITENDLFMEDSQLHLSCSPGYSMTKGTNATVIKCMCSNVTSCEWFPDPWQIHCLRVCGFLQEKSDAYTITNQTHHKWSTEGSVVEFQCVSASADALNSTTVCLSNGQWSPDPEDVCHALAGKSHIAIGLWLGITFLSVCVIVCGITTGTVCTIHMARRRKLRCASDVVINIEIRNRNFEQEEDNSVQSTDTAQHQEPVMKHLGIYSFLQQSDVESDPSSSRRSHHVYFELEPMEAHNNVPCVNNAQYNVQDAESADKDTLTRHQDKTSCAVGEYHYYCEINEMENKSTKTTPANIELCDTEGVRVRKEATSSPPPVPPQTELNLRFADPPTSMISEMN